MNLRISHNGNVIGTYPWSDWEKITIPCENKQMAADIVIEEVRETETALVNEITEEESGVQTRALPGGGVTLGYTVVIKSNDGTQTLFERGGIQLTSYIVDGNGMRGTNGSEWEYAYTGEDTFLGLSKYPNTTDYFRGTGQLASGTNTFYIVTQEAYKPIKVKYGDSELATLNGAKLTIKCAGKVMQKNIIIEKA